MRERCDSFDNPAEDTDVFFDGPSKLLAGSAKSLFCTYCKGEHTSNRCIIITDIAARKKFLRDNNRCFVCLRFGHTGNTCFSKFTCFFCKGKHHISICDRKNSSVGEQAAHNLPCNETSQLMISTQNDVLLQTATAMIRNGHCNSNWSSVKLL